MKKTIYTAAIFAAIILGLNWPTSESIFVVTSGSMEPTFGKGSIIMAKVQEGYRANDVITFSRNGKYITHRIVGEVSVGSVKYFITKGDANLTEDFDLVSREQIVGRI